MSTNFIALLIPAYCPTQNLTDLLEKLIFHNENIFSRIIIVDDGSGEEFFSLFARVSIFPGVTILKNAINLGKGAALKHGFNYIFTTGNEVGVVTADADGQHAPCDIIKLAQVAQVSPQAFILGVRSFEGDVPLRSWIGNKLTQYVLFFVTGLKLSDTQTGLRAWPKPLALRTLRLRIDGYDFELEALVKAKNFVETNLDIIQLPIATIYIDNNRSSHFNPLLDSMRIYFVFFRFCGAGLFTALIDNIVFIASFMAIGNVASSQVMGRVAGAVVSFACSRQLVFQSRVNWKSAIVKFFVLVTLFGFVSYGMINFLTAETNIGVIQAKLLTELLLFLGSFSIQREFIFTKSTIKADKF